MFRRRDVSELLEASEAESTDFSANYEQPTSAKEAQQPHTPSAPAAPAQPEMRRAAPTAQATPAETPASAPAATQTPAMATASAQPATSAPAPETVATRKMTLADHFAQQGNTGRKEKGIFGMARKEERVDVPTTDTGAPFVSSVANTPEPTPSFHQNDSTVQSMTSFTKSPTTAAAPMETPAPTHIPTAQAAPAATSFMPSQNTTSSQKRVLTVGPETCLKGQISHCDRVTVEGQVDAELSEVESLIITEGGEFRGSASVERAEISGVFDGSISVSGTLVINATGCVKGEIEYGSIEVRRGGRIVGEVGMANDDSADTIDFATSAQNKKTAARKRDTAKESA